MYQDTKLPKKAAPELNRSGFFTTDFFSTLILIFESFLPIQAQVGILPCLFGYAQYDLRVTLFYTDDVGLCLNRALERQQAGGHRVAESVILDMHAQTIPLLRKNIHLISHLQFVNVTDEGVELVYSGCYPTNFHEFIHPILPGWITRNFPEIQL